MKRTLVKLIIVAVSALALTACETVPSKAEQTPAPVVQKPQSGGPVHRFASQTVAGPKLSRNQARMAVVCLTQTGYLFSFALPLSDPPHGVDVPGWADPCWQPTLMPRLPPGRGL